MDSATTAVPVEAIPVPEGTTAEWSAVWLTCPADQMDALLERLKAEGKDIKEPRRFNQFTGEPVKQVELEWAEQDVAGYRRIHYTVRAAQS